MALDPDLKRRLARGQSGRRGGKSNPLRHTKAGEPYTIATGEVPKAPLEGRILGAAICEAGHIVLVVGDHRGKPVIEVHMEDDDVGVVTEMLRTARARH